MRAYMRELAGGAVGLRVSDIEEAVADELDTLASTLTRNNVGDYLQLPPDLDVVGVQNLRSSRKVPRPHRYVLDGGLSVA